MRNITRQKQSEIFEKIVNQSGKFFRVRFVVLERGGKLRGKVISCEPILAIAGVKDKGLRIKDSPSYLPCVRNTKSEPRVRAYLAKVISPFSALEFLTSIMVRAPAHNS